MYGIFTIAGALLVKFNATTFDAAFNVMDKILIKHPDIDKKAVYLCKTTI